MNKNSFYQQADLLISILPYIMTEDTDFALHGGTAINFFVRDMPRLSVDIDLVYLPVNSRIKSLKEISKKLKLISERVSSLPNIKVEQKSKPENNCIIKLFVKKQNSIVKIEPNPIIRGSLFNCEERNLCKRAEAIFEKFTTAKTLSFAELYGSKICAALDRQHPRDIFDIMLLLQNEGITNEVRKAFLVYLISHNRPISELLSPHFINMKSVFEKEFNKMTSFEIKYEKLENIRKTLVKEINQKLTDNERAFLLSFKERKPNWDLLGVKGAKDMPAVKWKLLNLEKMSNERHKKALNKLRSIL